MLTTASANFFSGWLGIGTAFGANVLTEPSDASYARRPFVLGPLSNGCTSDVFAGTIGPAGVSWGSLLFAGLFDQQAGGDLLLCWPLPRPVSIVAGRTWTSNGQISMLLSGDTSSAPGAVKTWFAGAQFATISAARTVTACQNLQVCNGVLSMLPTSVATSSTFSNLPSVSPASGSGQLWNNGGVICIA